MLRTILVVDDDLELLELLAKFLRPSGFLVFTAHSSQTVSEIINRRRIDLILLDVMLEDESGIDICLKLREDNLVPVIFISALSSNSDRIRGYEAGADDYIVKPFNLELLLVRIKAVISRSQRGTSISHRRRSGTFKFSSWEFKLESSRLSTQNGFEIILSRKEIALLFAFLSNPLIPITREEIFSYLYPDGKKGIRLASKDSRAIDVLVGRLRSKIEQDPKNPKLIVTEHGLGYVLSTSVQKIDV